MVTLSPEELERTRELQAVSIMAIEKLLNFKVLMVVSEDQKRAFLKDPSALDEHVKQHCEDSAWNDRLNRAWEKQKDCTEELRIRGDKALEKGEAYEAYTYYYACTFGNTVDPDHFVNKAAAALAGQSWLVAERDAAMALGCGAAHGANVISKARYYRGYARQNLGRLDEAEQDLLIAKRELPDDGAAIQAELARFRLLHEKAITAQQGNEPEPNWYEAEGRASTLRKNVATRMKIEPFSIDR